jgi:hypothetical protein
MLTYIRQGQRRISCWEAWPFGKPCKLASHRSSLPRPAAFTPGFLQSNPEEEVYLTEDLVKPPYDADNMYG